MCTYARIELFPTLFNTQGPAISAAGCLVGDEGGRVIQLVVKKNIGDNSGENNEDDDCLEEQDPYFGQQLNRNKERVVVKAEAVGEGVLALLQALYVGKKKIDSTLFEGAVVTPYCALLCAYRRSEPHYLSE